MKEKAAEGQTAIHIYDCDSLFNGKTISLDQLPTKDSKSTFDDHLIKSWQHAMDDGIFRYNLDSVQRRILPGNIKFVAQLNSKRFSERRKPQNVGSICQPFSNSGFNFNKVKTNEVLFKIQRSDREDDGDNLVVVNVSPIEFCHVLIVPEANKCHPQVLTEQSMRLAIETCFLSRDRGFRVGFNSLCAFASVNHLHFHAMQVTDTLPIDVVEAASIGDVLMELVNYPVLGLAVNVRCSEIDVMARKISCMIDRMIEKEVPHNIFMSRGDQLVADRNDSHNEDVVRLFIFPKVMSTGAKDTLTLNSCCYDLAGYLLMKDEDQYNKMDEVEAITILNRYTYREDEFTELKLDLLQVLQALG